MYNKNYIIECCEVCGRKTILYVSYMHRMVCPKCYIKDKDVYESKALAKQKYGPDKELALLK